MKKNSKFSGRLRQALNPVAHEIVYPVQNEAVVLKELVNLATLNEAHLISLYESKLLPLRSVKQLLKLIRVLRDNNFKSLLSIPAERGLYVMFEDYLTEKLGMNIAGSLHIGRSRNDINATVFKLSLRSFYKAIYNNLCTLRSTLLQKSRQYINVAMPIYSQYQVAQVGTYSFYMLGIEEALARDQYFIKQLYFSLDECPIGAAAGCGTSFATDPNLTAALLGFSRSCNNALDAVANRDIALRLLSTITVLATNLSRIAQDYQLWTTQEFAFFDLPDSLCGGSSMIPQKRNPYLFEVIKGKSASLNGMLIQALTGMHNVPFSNSVEVGTHALQGIEIALKNAIDILTLSELLISNAVPVQNQFIKSINSGVAIATNVAEFLVKERNIPFRKAHLDIGSHISESIAKQEDASSAILKLVDSKLEGNEMLYWAHLNERGGGPGKNSTKKAFINAENRLIKDSTWIKMVEKKWKIAEIKLKSSVKKVINLKR